MRVSKAFSIAGGIWFICFAAFGVLSIVIWADGMTDWDSFACGVLFLLSSLSGIFCMLFRRNYRIFYTDTFVEKHSTFGKKQVYRWAELISVQQKGAVYTLTFPSGKLRIASGKEYVGSDKLVDFFEKETVAAMPQKIRDSQDYCRHNGRWAAVDTNNRYRR